MMTTKFTSIMVITIGRHRQLAKSLKPFQLEYLKALEVTVGLQRIHRFLNAKKMGNRCLSRVLNVRYIAPIEHFQITAKCQRCYLCLALYLLPIFQALATGSPRRQ